MVFQSYALYPHMSVRQNLSFGLENIRMPKDEIARRVDGAAKLLQIDQLLGRRPGQLSGGQRQRVAIGRAIVREAGHLPLRRAALEPRRGVAACRCGWRSRSSRPARQHDDLRDPRPGGSHDHGRPDRGPARGRIEQVGRPLDLYNNPANKFVAGFIGAPQMNFLKGALEGRVLRLDSGVAREVPVARGCPMPVTLGSGPRRSACRSTAMATRRWTVKNFEQLGSVTYIYTAFPNGETLTVQLPRQIPLTRGQTIGVTFEPASFHLFGGEASARSDGAMRVALIGLGMVSRTYADAIRNSDAVRLAGVCARSEASRERFLSANADLGAVAMTVEEIAADPGIDFAILTTPPNARAEIVGKLAAARKPILMEKPVERTGRAPRGSWSCARRKACRSGSCSSTGRGRGGGTPAGDGGPRAARGGGGQRAVVAAAVLLRRTGARHLCAGRGRGADLPGDPHARPDAVAHRAGRVGERHGGDDRLPPDGGGGFRLRGAPLRERRGGAAFRHDREFPGRGETITLHFRRGSVRLEAGVLRIDRQDGTSETTGQAAARAQARTRWPSPRTGTGR